MGHDVYGNGGCLPFSPAPSDLEDMRRHDNIKSAVADLRWQIEVLNLEEQHALDAERYSPCADVPSIRRYYIDARAKLREKIEAHSGGRVG